MPIKNCIGCIKPNCDDCEHRAWKFSWIENVTKEQIAEVQSATGANEKLCRETLAYCFGDTREASCQIGIKHIVSEIYNNSEEDN